MCTLVHDELGIQDQHLYEKAAGKAGIYLNPSRIGGDGYRFRAQVSFARHPNDDWNHPNREVLEARYPKLPQAHTCALRNWRKASFRAYLDWGSGGLAQSPLRALPDYGVLISRAREQFAAAFVHFVHEDGTAKGKVLALRDLLDPNDVQDLKAYRDVIHSRISNADDYPAKDKMKLKEGNYWPWIDEAHYGFPWRKEDPPLTTDGFESWINAAVAEGAITKFATALMYLLIDRLEKRFGLLCGHFLAPYAPIPDLWKRVYICNGLMRHQVIAPERSRAEAEAKGTACPIDGCPGTLQLAYVKYYGCKRCDDTFDRCETSPKRDRGVPEHVCQGGPQIVPFPIQQEPPHGSEATYQSWMAPQLGVPGMAAPLGGVWLFLDEEEAMKDTTAHELGHHRHLSHTYALDRGNVPKWMSAQEADKRVGWHDHARNTTYKFSDEQGEKFENRWDRRCTMSDSTHPKKENNVGLGCKDKLKFFCGKCLLKLRGWKVEDLDVDGSKHDKN